MLFVGSFADIPTEVKRRVARGERVAVVLLDAFGASFLMRHRRHPLVQRLEVRSLRSQFPSTTTAHVTTMHFGMAVEDHGLYEWNMLEPSLDAIICPLRFNPAGSDIEGTLAEWLDPTVLCPGATFYETLGAPSVVLQPDWIVGSTFTRIATRGACSVGFPTLEAGVSMLAQVLDQRSDARYAFLYWDAIDRIGHEHGPSSPEFDAAGRAALNCLWEGLRTRRDFTLFITADHGQVDVSPERVDYLDDVWPELPALLSYPRPAGSSRDVFLHVRAERRDRVIDELSVRLQDRAHVLPAADLFDRAGPRLRQRLGDVAVLPAPGRQAWLRGAAANERWFRGHHGGRDLDEVSTYLAELTD
jgi:predicted AlkP superfamily pyrophosphatase or phosphodiesterase